MLAFLGDTSPRELVHALLSRWPDLRPRIDDILRHRSKRITTAEPLTDEEFQRHFGAIKKRRFIIPFLGRDGLMRIELAPVAPAAHLPWLQPRSYLSGMN